MFDVELLGIVLSCRKKSKYRVSSNLLYPVCRIVSFVAWFLMYLPVTPSKPWKESLGSHWLMKLGLIIWLLCSAFAPFYVEEKCSQGKTPQQVKNLSFEHITSIVEWKPSTFFY